MDKYIAKGLKVAMLLLFMHFRLMYAMQSEQWLSVSTRFDTLIVDINMS